MFTPQEEPTLQIGAYSHEEVIAKHWPLLCPGEGTPEQVLQVELSSLPETYVPGLCPLLMFFFFFLSVLGLLPRSSCGRGKWQWDESLGHLTTPLPPRSHAQTEAHVAVIKPNEQGQKPEQAQHCRDGNPHFLGIFL